MLEMSVIKMNEFVALTLLFFGLFVANFIIKIIHMSIIKPSKKVKNLSGLWKVKI